MPDPSTLAIFVAAAAVLLLTPGPTVLYIVTRSIDQGRAAGFASVAGVALGTLGHVVAAALGLSAILVASALAFNVVKYLGAIYLVYLGVRTLLTREETYCFAPAEPKKLFRVFYEGLLVNLLNPKTALFFLAFLPQFVDVSQGAVASQILILGSILIAMGAVSDSFFAFMASTFSHFLKNSLRVLRIRRYLAGSMYIALGVATAFAGSNRAS